MKVIKWIKYIFFIFLGIGLMYLAFKNQSPKALIAQLKDVNYLWVVISIIFGFAVGFTAYNFGALVRYKIPCLPTVGIVLAALYSLRLEKNDKKKSLQH